MNPLSRLLPIIILAAVLAPGAGLLAAAEQPEAPPDATADFWQVIEHRRSVRMFKPDSVPEADILRILDAARMAPTSGNQQPWKFLVVRDPAKIAAMKAACVEGAKARFKTAPDQSDEARQRFEARMQKALGGYFSAPVFIVVLTDQTSKYPDYNHWDGPLAAGQLMLAARSLGYGTVFITDAIPDAVTRDILGIPDRFTRVCITPLGVPVEWPRAPAKRPLEDFVAWETL